MRVTCLTWALAGCMGAADLGDEPAARGLDGGPVVVPEDPGVLTDAAVAPSSSPLDAGATPNLLVSPSSDACGLCYDLRASGPDPLVTYELRWEDGTREPSRRVCPRGQAQRYEVRVRAPGGAEQLAATQLVPRVGTCAGDAGAPGDLLCLLNPSFDEVAAFPPALPSTLNAAPWVACGASPNLPQLVDSSSGLMLPSLQLGATDGATFLSLATNEQVSQAPCAPITPGSTRSFHLDVAGLLGGVAPEEQAPVLEIWGGLSLDCSQRERLWSSGPLTTLSWQNVCVTITPSAPMDSLTLRAASPSGLPYPGRVLVDHIVPVASCP